MLCKLCNELEYIVKDGKRIPCVCARVRKLKAYFPYVHLDKVRKVSVKEAMKYAESLPIGKNLSIVTDVKEESLNLILLFYLLRVGSPSYHIMNSYELVEIYLEHHPEFKSILEISYDYLIVLYGYNEMANRRQEDLLLQLFDHYRRLDKKIIFVSRSGGQSLTQLPRYIMDNQWGTKDMTIAKVGSAYLK